MSGRVLIAMLPALALAGCTLVTMDDFLRVSSAGHTGCTPETLQISNRQSHSGGTTWNAVCNGKVYLCSDVPGKYSDDVACAPAADATAAP